MAPRRIVLGGGVSLSTEVSTSTVEREPTNWEHRFLLSRMEAELGDVEAATKAFADARRLRPHSRFLTPLD